MGWLNWIEDKLWGKPLASFPKVSRFFLAQLRLLVRALRGFLEDDCSQKCAALTFFTFFSLPSLLAVCFGIAKGFGLQDQTDNWVRKGLESQPQVAEFLIDFADKYLQNTKGGLIAGAGVLLLFWSFLQVVSSVERIFNGIWRVKRPREMLRQATDYFAAMLVCSLLLSLASSASVVVNTRLLGKLLLLLQKLPFLQADDASLYFESGLILALPLLTLAMSTLMFTFLFKFIPNTRVPLRSALYAGLVTGLIFMVTEYAFVFMQTKITSYNKIYGSFAALPLFLFWLKTSWMVVIYGAELCYSHQSTRDADTPPHRRHLSMAFRQQLGLAICRMVVRHQVQEQDGLPLEELGRRLKLPDSIIQESLAELKAANLVAELRAEPPHHSVELIALVPPDQLTLRLAINGIVQAGADRDYRADHSADGDLLAAGELLQLPMTALGTTGDKLLRDL